jgi:hypothetical protein
MKSYSEMCRCGTYEERLAYLQLHGEVGKDTFGFDRYLNQDFYRSKEWRQFRDRIIVRDGGCDLGCKDHPIVDIALSGGKMSRARITDTPHQPSDERGYSRAPGSTVRPGECHQRVGCDTQGHPLRGRERPEADV